MVKKFHVAAAACMGALFLAAAGVAPGAGGQQTTVLAVWQEPAPEVSTAQINPTVFPGSEMPIAQSIAPLAAASQPKPAPAIADEERRCLAIAVYHESRGEPRAGQMAVAQVIVNRARSGRYPKTLCGVVRQPSQFSGLRDATFKPRSGPDWRIAQAVAADVLGGERVHTAARAMHFHATRVQPGWSGKTRLATIGNHVFYR